MTKVKIDVFSEGKTEKNVIEQLAKRGFINGKFEERGGGGEPTMMANLRLFFREEVSKQQQSFNILLLRDLDRHEGKTLDAVCQSTIDVVCQYDNDAQLLPHEIHNNVFKLKTEISGLQLVLHIASQSYLDNFAKATIDDYVLRLALSSETAKALLNAKREEGERKNPRREWEIDEVALCKKIKEEIPSLLRSNKIPELIEAKEYIRFYIATLMENISPAIFAGKVLNHAAESDIRKVFAPLISATQLFSA